MEICERFEVVRKVILGSEECYENTNEKVFVDFRYEFGGWDQ